MEKYLTYAICPKRADGQGFPGILISYTIVD
jgi:hypothetical protein